MEYTEKKENRQKLIHNERLKMLEMIEVLSFDYETILFADLDENKVQAYRISERFEKAFENSYPMA